MRCYTRDELKSFVLGNLPGDVLCQISDHLDDCNVCEDTIVGLDQTNDSLLESLKSVRPGDHGYVSPHEKNADYELAVAAAHQLNQGQDSNAEPSLEPTRIGDYEIIATIGCGGMGSVFKARHMRLGKQVAVKILPWRKMRSPDAVARFNREMRIIGQMDHPGIVTAFDAGDEQGTHYLVMELVEGIDLGQLTRLCGPIGVADACELIRQSASGIQYAHQQDVIHRDIKPSNLMLTSDQKVKVLDLGLATLGSLDGTVDELTTVGQLMGTLDYMSPEQLGSEPITSCSDTYSLAATLYKLLTGSAPYSRVDCDTPLKKLRAIACSSPTPIRERCDTIPPDLAELIDRGLVENPAERFESVADFASQLEPFCRDANLKKLLDRATEAKNSQAAVPRSLPVGLQPDSKHSRAASPGSPTRIAKPKSKRQTTSWRHRLATALVSIAMLGLLAAGGIVVYIQTSTGQVVIESEVDDVKVVLLKNDQPSKELVVEHSSKSTRLFAGEYKVLIEGDSDSMVVENGDFQIKRGGVVVVRIREKPKAVAEAKTVAETVAEAKVVSEAEGTKPSNIKTPLRIAPEYEMQLDRFSMTVLGPKTPQPTGKEVAYKISITNKDKEKPKRLERLTMQFSQGIEPSHASETATILPGQIFFPAQVIGPGKTKHFKVIAIADSPGTHVYRVISDVPGHEIDQLEGTTSFLAVTDVEQKSTRKYVPKVPANWFPPSKPLPTYEGGTLERWLEVSIRSPTISTKEINTLAERTSVALQRQYVRKMIKNSELELSFKHQLRLFETLSLLAGDDEIADMLVDRIERLIIDEEKLNATGYYASIFRINPDAVKLRLDNMIKSKNSKLQEAAIIGASRIQEIGSGLPENEFQMGEEWLPPLLAFSNDKNAACNSEAVAYSLELFPNHPEVIKRELDSAKENKVSFNRIHMLVDAGCNDDSIHSLFIRLCKDLYKSHPAHDTSELLWTTALQNRFVRKDNSRLLDAVLRAFDDPQWGNELSPAISEGHFEYLKGITKFRGHSRLKWDRPANFRQAMIRNIFVPKFVAPESKKAREGNIPYDYFASFRVSKESHAEDVARLQQQLLDFAYKQLKLDLETEFESVRLQVYTEIDHTICRLKSLEISQAKTRSNKNYQHLLLPLYHGHDLEHWIGAAKAAKSKADLLIAANGVVALQRQSKNPTKLVFDMIPLFRDVSFDDAMEVSKDDVTSLSAAVISLAPRDYSFTSTRNRRERIKSPTRESLLENLNYFDERDANCLLAIIRRNALYNETQHESELVEFAFSQLDSDDLKTRRRAFTLCKALFKLSGLPQKNRADMRARFARFIEESVDSLPPEAVTAIIAFSIEELGDAFENLAATRSFLMRLEDPAKVSLMLKLLEQRDWKNLRQPDTLEWVVISALANNESWLDEAHSPESYDLWNGRLNEPKTDEVSPVVLFDRVIKLVDQGKCFIPTGHIDADRSLTAAEITKRLAMIKAAIETLENRAKTATGRQKKILDRVLARLAG